jgi:hypothetical protein
MIIDAHPDPRGPAAVILADARWDDFGLGAGLFWRSMVHWRDIMWVVQRQNAMHEYYAAKPRRRVDKG